MEIEKKTERHEQKALAARAIAFERLASSIPLLSQRPRERKKNGVGLLWSGRWIKRRKEESMRIIVLDKNSTKG